MCALLAHEIIPGDKIIVPAFTFIATASVPKILGAKIIPVDVDPKTLNILPEKVEEIVKKEKIKAVIVVDVGGLSVDIEKFKKLSKKYNFILIEDAAEAFGSEYKNKKNGSFNHTSIFSFHIAKLITTIEGGCISTKNKIILKKLRLIRNHGKYDKIEYVHDMIGSNFRTTDLQSAIGIEQIKKIKKFLMQRNSIAKKYKKNIKKLEFQKIPSYATNHSYMLFFAFCKNKNQRDKLFNHLKKHKIDVRKPWMPIHMQPCNQELHNLRYPNAENIFDKAITLPIYNSMSTKEVQHVIDSIMSIK